MAVAGADDDGYWPTSAVYMLLFKSDTLKMAFTVIFLILLGVRCQSLLYPYYFSPLRHIPAVHLGSPDAVGGEPSTVRGHVAKLQHYIHTVPNNGLLRFYLPSGQERILATGAQALNEILASDVAQFAKPQGLKNRLYNFVGNGLILAEGDVHKAQRKELMPAFSFRHIKDLLPTFWSKSKQLVKLLQKETQQEQNSNVVVIENWATRVTLDIIGLAGMNHDFDSLQDPNNSLAWQYRNMRQPPSLIEQFVVFILSLFTSHAEKIAARLPTPRGSKAKAASGHVRHVCRDLINDKRRRLENSKPETAVDIISVALKGSAFTNDNLVDQMMTFLAAGHNTTSHALQWSVYALCKHQDIQTRLRKEVRDNLPSISDPDGAMTPRNIENLPYLHAVCNEVLRFYPPISQTSREALHATTVAGYHIPKGTVFVIPIGIINRDVELWGPDASVFDPERWLGQGRAKSGGVKDHIGFLTFLHGPRNCIGSNFSRAELACLVAALVGRFQMELENPNEKVELSSHGIGSRPKDGVRTRLRIIEGW